MVVRNPRRLKNDEKEADTGSVGSVEKQGGKDDWLPGLLLTV